MDVNGIRIDREALPAELRDYSRWPQVDPLSLQGKRKRVFLSRCGAVARYLDGEAVNTICKNVPISRSWLHELVKKCFRDHPDGRIYGFRGLQYFGRQKTYRRTKIVETLPPGERGGYAGALSQLFERYPEIKQLVNAHFLQKKSGLGSVVLEARMQVQGIYIKFLNACRKKQIQGCDYPLNSPTMGKKALGNYLRKLQKNHLKEAVRARYGKEAAIKLGSDEGCVRKYAARPLERVEFDAHKLDSHWVLRLVDRNGDYIDLILGRIWLLVVLDEYSRAILGYFLCLQEEYSQYDALRCIKHAVQPWTPMELKIPELKYPTGGGIPSGVLSSYEWALWTSLTYDNALANLSHWVRELLKDTIGCEVNAGPKTTKDHQPFVERFFRTMETRVGHRLPNTTGSHPKDPLRNKPEKTALEHEMLVDDLREIVDVFLAEYNITPHEGLDYASPMEVLQRYASQKNNLIRHLPENKKHQLWWLNTRKTSTVRGNIKEGRRPFIRFFGACYSSQVLRNAPDLIGKKITLVFDPTDDDCRQIMAFLPSGEELGMLEVRGNWARSRHSS